MAETTTWIDSDGGELLLDVDWAVVGRFAPDAELVAEGVPGQPGQRLREARHGVHEFTMPFWREAATEAALRADLRDVVARMDPVRGDGRIRVVAPGGDSREIVCRVASGLGVNETLGQDSGLLSQRLAPVFRAYEPYWTATADTIINYPGGGVVATFFPFFPLKLSASETIADTDVTNEGDVDAWPVWTLTGPATDVVAENLTTGKSWSLTPSPALIAGQSATVDTRPGVKTVLRSDGVNLFPGLSASSSLWPLRRGVNRVRVSMGGSTAASNVRLAFRPRHLGP